MLDAIYKETELKMVKAIEATRNELSAIRCGRANPALVDHIRVDYYGSILPLNQIATVSIPEARVILISPWHKGDSDAICKALAKSNLGLTPSTDGNAIRISIPTLTQERRKELDKVVKKDVEEGRMVIRNIRRDAIVHIKALEHEKKISEDLSHTAQQKVQKITDEFIGKIDHILAEKEKEILEG